MLLSACVKNENQPGTFLLSEGIHEDFGKVFNEHELMGMSVLLIYHGHQVWEGNFGLADHIRRIPVSGKTMYRVASISKMIAATAILQLWEAGRVDLDTDVSHYLGWLLQHPGYKGIPITLRQLMSHTSGIRDGDAYYRFSGNMILEKLGIEELFQPGGKYFDEGLFAGHEPGKYFAYANCTWGLVATIVEKVSGERFDDYCRKHILRPLGMRADFDVAAIDTMDDIAVLYRFVDGAWTPQADDYQGIHPASRAFEGYRPGQNGLVYGPQGSLRSSARDLARFMQMLMNDGSLEGQQIMKKETANLMMEEQWHFEGNNGDTGGGLFLSYGLAVHRTGQGSTDAVFPDRTMVGHPGDAYGLLSGMYFDRKTRTGIIFITNGGRQLTTKGSNTSFFKVEEDAYATAFSYVRKLESRFPYP